jgi:hypothetical protein
MNNAFIKNGSIADLMNYITSDLKDTYENQTDFLGDLIDCQDLEGAIRRPFTMDNLSLTAVKESGAEVLNVYRNNATTELYAAININSDENTGRWASINDLTADVMDAADSTYVMMTAAQAASEDESSPLLKFSTAVSSWIGTAGVNAKECYGNIVDTLACGSDSKESIVTWLVNQYQSVANSSGDAETGEIVFTDDNYHVQGFAGSYAVGLVFNVVTTVVSAVATVIAPIVGLAISGVAAGVRWLFGLIPNTSDTVFVENDASNTLYAQPVFQGVTILHDVGPALRTYGTDPYGNNIYNMLMTDKTVCIRIPGWEVHLMLDPSTSRISYEMFVSCDYANYRAPALYARGVQTQQWKIANPYSDNIYYRIINSMPGGTFSYCCGKTAFKSLIFGMKDALYPGSVASFADDINSRLNDDQNPYAPEDVVPWMDKCIRTNISYNIYMMISAMNAYVKNGSDNVPMTPQAPNQLNYDFNIPNKGSTVLSWIEYWNGKLKGPDWSGYSTQKRDIGNSWENLCNKIIPRIRETWRNEPDPILGVLFFMEVLSEMSQDPTYVNSMDMPIMVTRGIPSIKKFKWLPPKYSRSARAATIALAATAAVITAAALITKTTLKIKLRKKQIGKYADIQKKFADIQSMEPGQERDNLIKSYRKDIRRYNRMCTITGNSRLSGISGWETGSDTSIAKVPSFNSGDSSERVVYSMKNDETDSSLLIQMKQLIRGF